MVEEGVNTLKIVEETYEEIKKEIEARKREVEGKGKRYYMPFAIGQEADEYPLRTEQIDMFEQTLMTWLACPGRQYAYLQHRVMDPTNATVAGYLIWLDGQVCGHNERGRYPVKHDDRVTAALTCYNYNDLVEKAYSPTVSNYEKWVFENIPASIGVLTCVLFDIYGKGYFSDKPKGGGHRCQTYSVPGLGSFVQTHPVEDNKIFSLWEDMKWKRADIKKLKANIWLVKKPTVIRAKKAEIKKIKADNWIYRGHSSYIRWERWKWREIWALKEEIKRLKREGRGDEKIEEIEEPKEYRTNRPYYETQRRYLYPHRLNREKVKLKSIEEYKAEIRNIKGETKRMKEERKERLKEGIKKGKEWLKEYREEYKKKMREHDKLERIKELQRRWKKYKKWFIETSKKRDVHYDAYKEGGAEDAPELKEALKMLYIPTETDFERKHFQEIRGDPRRENMITSHLKLRKLWRIEIARSLGNRKGKGLGKLVQPNIIDELIARESRGVQGSRCDFTSLIFKTAHFNWGMGEWKELPRNIRKKIPYPLVYRPIFDKNGYSIHETDWEYGTQGRWECRPLHPRDAWNADGNPLWTRLYCYVFFVLSKFISSSRYPWWVTGGPYHYRPFDRLLCPYHIINRLAMGFFFRFWK